MTGNLFDQPWLRTLGPDLLALAASALMVAAYHFHLRFRVRQDPTYSIHVVNEAACRLWVQHVMANPSRDVMAVQTLRNFIMVGILMVPTATLLIIGTLTLSGQADTIARSWHAIDLLVAVRRTVDCQGDVPAGGLPGRLLRLHHGHSPRHHVLFMINVPAELRGDNKALAPDAVARRLNRAGYMISVGIRSLFVAVPLVFWLFGPAFLVIATIGLLIVLYRLDRNQIIV